MLLALLSRFHLHQTLLSGKSGADGSRIVCKTKLTLLRFTKIPLEKQVQESFRELWVIVHMFVELEVTIDHILKQVIYDVVKGEAGIFGRVDAHACFEGSVVRQPLFYLAYTQLVFFCEVSAKMLIELLDDLR